MKTSIENNACLFDTNVIIDAFSNRSGDSKYSQYLMSLAASGRVHACLCSTQITDIYYVLRKYMSDEERRRAIRILLDAFRILPLLGSDLSYCLKAEIADYEDAILDEVAKVNCVRTIVTNNKIDFCKSKNVIVSPKELCQLLSIDVGIE